MRTPTPLPPTVHADRYYTKEQLDALGVTDAQRRRLVRPHRGVYGLRHPQTALEDARAASLVLPARAAFSHDTAARLHRLPLPQRWDPVTRPPVDVVIRGSRPKTPTIRAHRPGSQPIDIARLPGLDQPVVTPPHVFMQLAPHLGLLDLVILGDAVVRWRSPWRLPQLREAVRHALPGVVQARRALALVREDSNSPTETRTRLHLLDAGLPAPLLNAPVVVDGQWLAFVDFYWPSLRLVVEYYGIHHFATDRQRRDDIHRVRALRDHDHRVEELTKEDLDDPPALVARVASAMRAQSLLLGLPTPA